MRLEKPKLDNVISKGKLLDNIDKDIIEKEFLRLKEQKEKWDREAERKKMLEEKHRKDIEDMMKKKPF